MEMWQDMQGAFFGGASKNKDDQSKD
jgi:hypothetical protein